MMAAKQVLTPFFGRDEIINRLEQRLEALKKGYRQNIALVGAPFMGKTSLLRHFLEKVRRDSEIIPIYILLTTTDFEGFLERWLGSLLQSFLTFQGIAFPEEFQQLVKISRQYIPKTLERMRETKRHAFQKKTTLAFRELLSLTVTLREETGKKILLILDEFQNIGELEAADPFGLFGKEMMIQKDTLYLATSSKPHRSREIFGDRLSLLFGNFEVIEVGALSSAAIRKFAETKFPDVAIPEVDFRILSHLLNNHPRYFELFLEAAYFHSMRSHQMGWSREFCFDVMTELVFSDRGALNRHFESQIQNLLYLGRSPRAYIKVLLAVANGRSKAHPIAAYTGKKGSETTKLLQRLVGEGILEKKGSFYCLNDPLFRFWLKNVFQIKERELTPDRERGRDFFRHRLAEEFRKIEEEDHSDLTARIENLFKEFRNDVVEINRKKVKCPAFLELATRPTNGRYFPIQGRSLAGRWFCQVFREPVTEADVNAFVEEFAKSRKKVQRKLMITLGGMDLNAKLMAQEAKIQIWDLENLNVLLDLYGKLKVLF